MPGAAAALTVVLVVGSCVLAGCGTRNPYALPAYDPHAVASAPSRPSASATTGPSSLKVQRAAKPPPQVKYSPADALGEGAWVERGKIIAKSAQDRAVVAAMTKYLSAVVQLSNTWQVDDQALAAVASGEAFTRAQERADRQRNRDWRSIGRFVINVSSVKVNGSQAAVTGCHFDGTSEVDQNGGVVIAPPGGVRITMTLQRTGGTWRVVDWPNTPAPVCHDWTA